MYMIISYSNIYPNCSLITRKQNQLTVQTECYDIVWYQWWSILSILLLANQHYQSPLTAIINQLLTVIYHWLTTINHYLVINYPWFKPHQSSFSHNLLLLNHYLTIIQTLTSLDLIKTLLAKNSHQQHEPRQLWWSATETTPRGEVRSGHSGTSWTRRRSFCHQWMLATGGLVVSSGYSNGSEWLVVVSSGYSTWLVVSNCIIWLSVVVSNGMLVTWLVVSNGYLTSGCWLVDVGYLRLVTMVSSGVMGASSG